MKRMILSIAICVLAAPFLHADDLDSISEDEAQKWGARLAALASKIEDPQIKIVGNADKANGVQGADELGFIIVPRKDLNEVDDLVPDFQSEFGAPLAYLFTYHAVPVVDGKPADASRLRTITVTDDEGSEHSIYVLLLSVRKRAEDDYRLFAFGKDKQPVVDAQFSEDGGPGPTPIAVEVKNVDEQAREGDVVITLFEKYQASFRAVQSDE